MREAQAPRRRSVAENREHAVGGRPAAERHRERPTARQRRGKAPAVAAQADVRRRIRQPRGLRSAVLRIGHRLQHGMVRAVGRNGHQVKPVRAAVAKHLVVPVVFQDIKRPMRSRGRQQRDVVARRTACLIFAAYLVGRPCAAQPLHLVQIAGVLVVGVGGRPDTELDPRRQRHGEVARARDGVPQFAIHVETHHAVRVRADHMVPVAVDKRPFERGHGHFVRVVLLSVARPAARVEAKRLERLRVAVHHRAEVEAVAPVQRAACVDLVDMYEVRPLPATRFRLHPETEGERGVSARSHARHVGLRRAHESAARQRRAAKMERLARQSAVDNLRRHLAVLTHHQPERRRRRRIRADVVLVLEAPGRRQPFTVESSADGERPLVDPHVPARHFAIERERSRTRLGERPSCQPTGIGLAPLLFNRQRLACGPRCAAVHATTRQRREPLSRRETQPATTLNFSDCRRGDARRFRRCPEREVSGGDAQETGKRQRVAVAAMRERIRFPA